MLTDIDKFKRTVWNTLGILISLVSSSYDNVPLPFPSTKIKIIDKILTFHIQLYFVTCSQIEYRLFLIESQQEFKYCIGPLRS